MRRLAAVASILALVALGSAPAVLPTAGAQDATPAPDPAANAALVRAMVDAVFNAHDVTAIDAFFAAHFVDHEADPAVTTGLADFKQSAAATFAAFPDIHYAIEDLAADGAEVWTRTGICGTQTGAYAGVPATGRRVCVEAIDIVRIAGGRIAEHWGLIDELGLLRQLGALPGA
jgi:steroid delta-isomerase-like uncharacterized protein